MFLLNNLLPKCYVGRRSRGTKIFEYLWPNVNNKSLARDLYFFYLKIYKFARKTLVFRTVIRFQYFFYFFSEKRKNSHWTSIFHILFLKPIKNKSLNVTDFHKFFIFFFIVFVFSFVWLKIENRNPLQPEV